MDLLELFLFILPAYVANGAPVILGGKTPIDFGINFFDKKRIFGSGKTIRGFIAGVAVGTIAGTLLAYFPQFMPGVSFNDKILISFFLAFGTLIGDTLGSFIKRRRGIERGEESLFTDKLWFLIIALIIASPFYNGKINLQLIDVVILVIMTFVLHIAFNRIAHAIKLKKVPW